MSHTPSIQQEPNRIHTGQGHYLARRDLERRLDYQQRLNLHLLKLNKYLAAQLAEVRYDR